MKNLFQNSSIILTFLLLWCMTPGAFAQPSTDPELQTAIRKASSDLAQLVNESNFKSIGLDSPDEAKSLTPGKPVQYKMIGLEDLRKYQGGSPSAIIKNLEKASVPLYNNRQRVALVADFDKGRKGWALSSFGSLSVPKNYEEVMRKHELKPDETFILTIPALNANFLATQRNQQTEVVLLGDQPIGDLRPGVKMKAEEALRQLVPVANQYNGLPW
jgi:hypothetical protein